MAQIDGTTIACLATDGVEQVELTERQLPRADTRARRPEGRLAGRR